MNPMIGWTFFTLILLAAGSVIGCAGAGDDDDSGGNDADDEAGDDDGADDTTGSDDDDDTDDDTHGDDDAPACDDSKRPIVFVHGFLASGDTWANPTMRFAANGYCLDRLFAFDYNSLGTGLTVPANLDAFIDGVRTLTGSVTVDLVGHSQGGAMSALFLSTPERAAKIAHYAHVASFGLGEAPGGVPTLVISSPDDHIAGSSEIPGADNVSLPGLDHMQVATSAASFQAVYAHFNDGQAPETSEIVPEDDIRVWGRVVSLGENTPGGDLPVAVYVFDPNTGLRTPESPVAELTTDALGYWGPFEAEPETHYEFVVTPTGDDQYPVHYFRQPFVRSNDLVYLRILPSPGSLAGLILGALTFDDDRAVLITYTPNQAAIAGRDSLWVEGYELTTEAILPADKTGIAVFYFDADDDGLTDATAAGGLFAGFPFLAGFDMFLAVDPPGVVTCEFNGRSVAIPKLPSATEGALIAVFE